MSQSSPFSSSSTLLFPRGTWVDPPGSIAVAFQPQVPAHEGNHSPSRTCPGKQTLTWPSHRPQTDRWTLKTGNPQRLKDTHRDSKDAGRETRDDGHTHRLPDLSQHSPVNTASPNRQQDTPDPIESVPIGLVPPISRLGKKGVT